MLDIIILSDGKSNTSYPNKLCDQISNEKNVNIEFFKVSFFTIIKLYKKIFFYTIKNKKLIINTHHFKGALSIFLIKNIFTLKKFKNIKWVHTFNAENHRFRGFKRIMNFIVYSKSDYLVGVSDMVSLQWMEFLKRKNIKTINCGISIKEYSIIKNASKKSDKILKLLWVGRLENVKNPLMIIEALDKITSKEKKIDLIIIGNGSLLKSIKSKIKNFNNKSYNKNICIKLYSEIDRRKVLENIGNAKIYINTSYSESFCISALEALVNSKCFLLLPDLDTLRNLFKFDNVIFYKKNSVKDLSQNIENLIKKPFLTKTLYASRKFPKKFKLENSAKKYLDLYSSLFI